MSSCAVHFWACHFIMHASHTYYTILYADFSTILVAKLLVFSFYLGVFVQ